MTDIMREWNEALAAPMPEPAVRYVCRSCGTKWVQRGQTVMPIWGPRGKNCQGRIEPVKPPSEEPHHD